MKLRRPTPPDPRQLALQLDFSDPPAPAPSRTDPPAPPASAPLPPAHPRRRLLLRDHPLDYRLLRSKRRTIGFLIDDEGLRITAPKWVTLAEIENAIREKERWILNKLSERRERLARRLPAQMQWCDGAALPYLGIEITLRVRAAQTAGVAFDAAGRELTVNLPPDSGEQQLKDRVQAWLQQEARRVFAERLPLYAEKLGASYRAFALSSATTQWGSCTADGRIRLNWRLIHFGLSIIDYVVAHELAHLREMNHSPRFWATVQSIFPGFEEARRALRERGPETLPIF
ncbi:MAG TPA: SprT family zinc-dependent metalloprotease [Noviherbaspirillum sp.]|nr:SprT family zinc-dependent metalloprotease [Noviherbaspirillum sp.]